MEVHDEETAFCLRGPVYAALVGSLQFSGRGATIGRPG
jgi:hypothetical protein